MANDGEGASHSQRGAAKWVIYGSCFLIVSAAAYAVSTMPDSRTPTFLGQPGVMVVSPDGTVTPAGPGPAAVGERRSIGRLELTLLRIEDPVNAAAELPSPPPGRRYVFAEFSLTSTDDVPVRVGLIQTMDRRGINYYWLDIDDMPLGRPGFRGTTEPHGSRRGWILLEVPADEAEYRVNVTMQIRGGYAPFQFKP